MFFIKILIAFLPLLFTGAGLFAQIGIITGPGGDSLTEAGTNSDPTERESSDDDRLTREQIRDDYLSLIPSLVLIECRNDPDRPQNQQLCAREETLRENFYALVKFEELIRLRDEEGVPYNGGLQGGYQGGCVLVRIRTFEVSRMRQDSRFPDISMSDVIEDVYHIHYLPIYDDCAEGELSEYGSAGAGMWRSP